MRLTMCCQMRRPFLSGGVTRAVSSWLKRAIKDNNAQRSTTRKRVGHPEALNVISPPLTRDWRRGRQRAPRPDASTESCIGPLYAVSCAARGVSGTGLSVKTSMRLIRLHTRNSQYFNTTICTVIQPRYTVQTNVNNHHLSFMITNLNKCI